MRGFSFRFGSYRSRSQFSTRSFVPRFFFNPYYLLPVATPLSLAGLLPNPPSSPPTQRATDRACSIHEPVQTPRPTQAPAPPRTHEARKISGNDGLLQRRSRGTAHRQAARKNELITTPPHPAPHLELVVPTYRGTCVSSSWWIPFLHSTRTYRLIRLLRSCCSRPLAPAGPSVGGGIWGGDDALLFVRRFGCWGASCCACVSSCVLGRY